MKALDANILVYAHRKEPTGHSIANDLLRRLTEGDTAWAIPWPCVYEFFSVVTNPRIWKHTASSPEQAWNQLSAWTDSPTCCLLNETSDFMSVLGELAQRPRVRGPIIHDARVAAICLAHGAEELLTADRDFSLFPELRTHNPIG